MRPRGLYVVESEKMFGCGSMVHAKLSTYHKCLTDELIEKAKVIAKENHLSKFAVVYTNTNNITRVLYIHK